MTSKHGGVLRNLLLTSVNLDKFTFNLDKTRKKIVPFSHEFMFFKIITKCLKKLELFNIKNRDCLS